MPAEVNDYAYADHRLQQWAEWSARMEASGLGYPRRVHWINNHRRGGNPESAPPIGVNDERAMEVERLVNRLPPPIRRVVILEYLRGGPRESKYRRAGCSDKTYNSRLQTGRQYLSLALAR